MDVSHDDVKSSWFRMQLKATCNIEKSHFNDWFTGHLNFQIEHQYVFCFFISNEIRFLFCLVYFL
jgi:hypothetical protein